MRATVVAGGANVVGAGMLVLATAEMAAGPRDDPRSGWWPVAAAGLAVALAGDGALLAGLRGRLAVRRGTLRFAGSLPPAVVPSRPAVMVVGGTRRHRPGCSLVAGKRLVPAARVRRDAAACGVCRP